MPFPLLLKLTLYLLVLDAFWALVLTQILEWPGLVATLLAIVGSWWADELRPRIPHYRKLWDVLTAVFLVYAVLDFLLLAESFIAAVVHLLLFLQAYKLFNARTARDLRELFGLTFLQLVAASTLTVSFGFLLVFCLYMILGIWGLILLHLKRETEAAFPERSRDLLAGSEIVSPGFLLSSVVVALGSLALTLAIFFVIPRVGWTYLPLKAQIGTLTTGFTDRVELGVYGTIQTDPTIVMRVSFLDGHPGPVRAPDLRWRGVAFDRFDGRTWSLGEAGRSLVRRVREGYFPVGPHRLGEPFLAYEVFLEPIGSDVLFGLPRIVSVSGRLPAVLVDAGEGLNLPAPPGTRLRYLAISQPERFPAEALDRPVTPGEYPAEIRKAYLQLPEISPRLRALARELAAGAATPYRVARRVETYLDQNLRYSLDLRRESDLAPLDEFLFARKAGNCEYFAASMAILLRSVGIPARVVNGFQRGEWNEVGQFFAVRQLDAHAWVEVYFPGVGWVTFDPSPRAAFEAEAFGATGWAGKYFDALRMRWNRYVIDYSLSDQALFATRLRQQSAAVRRGLGQAWDRWSLDLGSRLRWLWHAHGTSLAVLLALLAAGGILVRRAPVGEIAGGWVLRARARRRTVGFYERALALLARRGWPKPAAATAREFASSLAGRPQLHGPVLELTGLYERVRFGGEPLTSAEERQAAHLLRRLAAAR